MVLNVGRVPISIKAVPQGLKKAAEKLEIPAAARKNHPSTAEAGAVLLDLLAPFDLAQSRL